MGPEPIVIVNGILDPYWWPKIDGFHCFFFTANKWSCFTPENMTFFVLNAIELRIEARQNRLILSFHWYVPPSIAGFSIWMEIHGRFFARLQIPQKHKIRNILFVREQFLKDWKKLGAIKCLEKHWEELPVWQIKGWDKIVLLVNLADRFYKLEGKWHALQTKWCSTSEVYLDVLLEGRIDG